MSKLSDKLILEINGINRPIPNASNVDNKINDKIIIAILIICLLNSNLRFNKNNFIQLANS